MRGGLTEDEYTQEIAMVRAQVAQWSQQAGQSHWREYLDAWNE